MQNMQGFELKALLLRDGDGTGRLPRPVQTNAFEWIGDNFPTGNHLVLRAPTGFGKSYVIKALQLQLGCPVINNKNVLLEQNKADYPDANYYKGKLHYLCKKYDMPCDKRKSMCEGSCTSCPLTESRDAADKGEPTYFNPMSYWYFLKRQTFHDSHNIIIDEAHSVLSQLRNLSNLSFKLKGDDLHYFKSRSDSLKTLSAFDILEWYYWKMDSLEVLLRITTSIRGKLKLEELKERLTLVMTCVIEEEEKYSFFIQKNTLHVQSINVSRFLIKKMFPGRIILLSGTLMTPDLKEFFGNERYSVCNLPSPIPKENRPVLFLPTPFRLNKKEMDYARLVEEVESDILAFCPKGNVIVHTTYEMSERMLEYWTLPNIITHDKKNKELKLQRFISRGGVFIASGCEEGLDLKDDLCHLNIIAKVRWPNLGDPWVQKRKAYYGNLWYLCETLKTVVQSAGRSTRSSTDRSLIIIKDPSFSSLREQTRAKKEMPEWFDESIISIKAGKVKNEFSRLPYEGNGPVRDEVYQSVWPNTKRKPTRR